MPERDLKLTFDEFYQDKYDCSFNGTEIAGLFLALAENEESIDQFQRSALEKLRLILYKTLSIEDIECIQSLYVKKITEKCG